MNLFPSITIISHQPLHYFFPDFLIPWEPAFIGPLPFAFSAISLLALAAVWYISISVLCLHVLRDFALTGFLLFLECFIVFVDFFLFFLGSF